MNVAEERRKLTATWLNAIASGAIVTGFIAPTIAVALNVSNLALGFPVVLVSLAWLGVGCTLHLIARRVLGGRIS
jgi:hypothetical protein